MLTLMKQKKITFLTVRKKLLDQKVSIFTHAEFRRLFPVSASQAKYFLETYTAKGMFLRLKPGLYAFEGRMPGGEEIANALYKPSYISFEYALAQHGVIPESVYVVTSATTKSTRFFDVHNRGYEYLKIKKEAFTGYALTRQVGEREYAALVADPEKALVDFLYFVSLGKKSWNDRIDAHRLDKKKIQNYAALFDRPGLTKLLEQL
jgi:predicted transcriptional regulator of viral defense system